MECFVNLYEKCDKEISFAAINEALSHKLQKTNTGGI